MPTEVDSGRYNGFSVSSGNTNLELVPSNLVTVEPNVEHIFLDVCSRHHKRPKFIGYIKV